jgi:cytochrome c-type biogenesis protein
MYNIFSQLSAWLSRPFLNMAYTIEAIPLIFAFVLGLVGALAPCQLTGNISAIMLYGNQSLQKKIDWKNVFSFNLGKIFAFSALGLLIWLVGNEVEQRLTLYFP